MPRSPRRVPTVHELDERLTNVERELAQVVSTVTSINKAATDEAKWFRDAFVEHRGEVRKGFTDTASDLGVVKSDVTAVKTDLGALKTEVVAIRSELTALGEFLRQKLDKN